MFGWLRSNGCSASSTRSIKVTKTITTSNGQQTVTTTTYNSGSQPDIQWESTPITPRTPSRPIATSTPPAISFNLNQFEKDCLDEHNRLRARHGCPPLTMNQNLCAYATEWAKKQAANRSFQHRNANRYGENLFMASGQQVGGKMVVKNWYEEIKQYQYFRPAFTSGTGHFTQVVWKESRQLGIGVGTNGNSTWVVANYDPPGNCYGKFAENVPRPI